MAFLKKGKTNKNQPQILKNKIFFLQFQLLFFLTQHCHFVFVISMFFFHLFIKHFLFSFPLFPADFALNLCYKNSYWFFILILLLLFSYSWFFISVLIPATVAKKNSKAKGFCCFCFLSHRKTNQNKQLCAFLLLLLFVTSVFCLCLLFQRRANVIFSFISFPLRFEMPSREFPLHVVQLDRRLKNECRLSTKCITYKMTKEIHDFITNVKTRMKMFLVLSAFFAK